ncbi:hypothetical protein BKH43_00510 [Helicobacter sp. 13S00401-1]|uniref:amidohydrolase family protein n=1 Tax=Helicobacter sp. 13S00401-1 TaxID=1905758 RepID=UPI000BA69EE9|nr:amidohydrolase family protein [Helicobacter sp. 13S00401-1]PAF51752.1 hypothetical protein BKH43_00510 [Helicobacter sp. 13S00401-1]
MLFKGAKVLTKDGFKAKDVLVSEGKIVEIKDDIESSDEVFECKGLALLPALLDVNILPKDSILNSKNLLRTSQKALKGGVGSLYLSPNTKPRNDTEAINALVKSVSQSETINIFSLIPAFNENGNLNDISILYSGNPKSAIFLDSDVESNLLYQAFLYAKMLKLPLIVNAFDTHMEVGLAYESPFIRSLGLGEISFLGQLKEIAKIAQMAEFLKVNVLFSALNVSESFKILKESKYLFSQVPLPHLIFDETNLKDYDTRYKLNPPLLPKASKDALLKLLNEAYMLTSLHSTVSVHLKNQVYEDARASFDSIEHYFGLAYTFLVKSGVLSLQDLLAKTSKNIANFMGLNKGEIAVGKDSDFMLVDLESSYKIANPASPLDGLEIFGIIKYMVVGKHISKI